MRNHSYEDDFDLQENETACKTHFHMKGFALRLVLKQRRKRTRKWSTEMLLRMPKTPGCSSQIARFIFPLVTMITDRVSIY